MLPRPLSHPHHLLVRLPSDGELARTRTAAPERSQSRLTSHGARDDTRHRSSDISRLRARTHALPSAPSCTGLSSGSDLTLRSGSPPTPPTYARSQPTICQPRSSSSLEPPEEVGHRSRGSRGGWAPDRRGCPGSRASQHPRRGGHPVAPQWSWPILVVSSRLVLRPNRHAPLWPSGCSAEHGTLAAAWREALSKRPTRLRLRSPSPGRAVVHFRSGHLRCPLGEKGSFPKMTLDTPQLQGSRGV